MDLHGLAEERSLAYHRAIAEMLLSQSGEAARLCAIARERATAWANSTDRSAPYAREWLELLALPATELAVALTDTSDRGRARRQATPFAGALDPRARWRLWKDVRARWSGA